MFLLSKRKSFYRQFGHNYDEHHILYQGRHWGNPGSWSARLRNHPYYRRIIPTNSLHREIHSKIHDIPVPSGKICHIVFDQTELALANGTIDDAFDTLERRIDFFIDCLKDFPEEDTIATIVMLREQRKVISRFYAKNQ